MSLSIPKKAALLLPICSGLLQFASFPLPARGYLAWIAFVPLLAFVLLTRGVRSSLWGGSLAGFVSLALILYWIPGVLSRYGGVPVALAWILFIFLAAVMSLYSGAACAFTRYVIERGGHRYLFAFPFVWVVLEYLRGQLIFGGFPWLLTGYSQTDSLRLIQISDITGVYGVSFVITWINAALVWAALRRMQRESASWPVITALLMIPACLLYGEIKIRHWEELKPTRTTVLLQQNLSADEPEPELAEKFQDGYVRMADLVTKIPVDLLVLPEAPTPLSFQHDKTYRDSMRALARRYGLGMVFNNIGYDDHDGKTAYFNSAYFLDHDGTESARYDKIHLVPFGEYIPWRKLFFFAESITKDVTDFSAGSNYTLAPLDGHRGSALVCFEAVFPEISRRFTRDGSELLVNLTNDGWYGRTAAPYQHLAMARWRAVENRRFLLRAANTGISAIVRPTGSLQAVTGLFREEICAGLFAFSDHKSVYARVGDLFVLACAIIVVLLGFLCFRRKDSNRTV
jgi:apolipoprotein N-acyltransferase